MKNSFVLNKGYIYEQHKTLYQIKKGETKCKIKYFCQSLKNKSQLNLIKTFSNYYCNIFN